jgi:hypothetical protein
MNYAALKILSQIAKVTSLVLELGRLAPTPKGGVF